MAARSAPEDVQDLIPVGDAVETLLPGTLTVPGSKEVDCQLVDPRAVRRHYDPTDLVELASQVQQADRFIAATATSKLQLIVDQIRYLQEQAKQVLQTAKRDAQLHHAACNFKKIPGQTYHLYEKDNGTTYFSMLSPKDWNGKPPHRFLGSYKLQYDQSWTPAEEVEEREKDLVAIQRVLTSSVPAITSSMDRRH